ncbi:spore germination protein [Brevibacillus ruminantium]|uniref:Spore germination protein n=1 Tax=Brevibacillus ruminantium TaxID=2950604 RepID=A0ABY4WJ40_9BACL|nr:spore germination protein [Brevibacillus ruminantium]USG66719.1 spore germination protein [Brevibacillus ruminantium]
MDNNRQRETPYDPISNHGELPPLNRLRAADIRQLFSGCHDVSVEEYGFLPHTPSLQVYLIYANGLCDKRKIMHMFLPRISELFEAKEIANAEDLERKRPFLLSKLKVPDAHTVVDHVFNGKLLLLFEAWETIFSIDLTDRPERSPEEPSTEVSVRGPRDGFIEDITVNVALVRKRLKTPLLHYEVYTAGSQTRTRIGLMYLHQTVDPKLIEEIRNKLSSIKTNGIVSSTQLEELILDTPFTLLPMYEYTGRPDFAVNSLLTGRFVIFVDGSPTALVAPVNFSFLLNTAEDVNVSFYQAVFVRLIRLISVGTALFLPGFWVALITYHQDQLPYTLIATIFLSRQGVPLPAALETLLMLMLFELFREAGLRMPTPIGQTLSVVGGLVVGQAAISAGLTSPASLVIMAISVMATYTILNQSLVASISITRIAILLICSFLGAFGFMMALIGTLLFYGNTRSYGVYYMEPFSPPVMKDLLKVLIRTPWRLWEGRASILKRSSRKELDSE